MDAPLIVAQTPPVAAALDRRRWWIVALIAALGAAQTASWNLYSPISSVVEQLYGWDDSFVEVRADAEHTFLQSTLLKVGTPQHSFR